MGFLTNPGRGTTAALCLCALTHSYLLFSIFPYAGYFCIFLLNNDDDTTINADSVGIYAGLLGSVFTVGRTVGFMPWKMMRSTYGGRNSLLSSLVLSALFSITFGLSQSFLAALLSRFLLGLSNGISGSVKRAAIDRARSKKNGEEDASEEEEEWASARILAVMSWGCAFGPAIGGWLSDPRGQYSEVGGLMSGSRWLFAYPFLLPNLFGALLCLFSALAVLAVAENDAPDEDTEQHATATTDGGSKGETSPLVWKNNDSANPHQPNGHANKPSAFAVIWKAKSTHSHLVAYWAFSFCVVCIDEALPLYLIGQLGGHGLSESQVGWIFATSAVVNVLCHHASIGTLLTDRMGVYPALHLSALLGNVPSVLLPLSLIINGGTYAALALSGFQPGVGVRASSFLFLAILVGILRSFATLYFALIGVATGRTVPLAYKDDTSRIMTIGALAARAVAPVVAGGIVTLCMSSGRSWALWCTIGLFIGTCTATLTYVLRDAAGTGWGAAPSGISKRRSAYLSERQRARAYAQLWEVHYDRGSGTVGAKWRRVARKAIAVNRFAGGALSAAAESPGAAAGVALEKKEKQNKRVSWMDRNLRPGIDVDEVPFFILGTFKGDTTCQPHVMTPPLMDALHKHLPPAVSECNYWLKYSLIRDGSSLRALENKAGVSRYTVMAIETLDGNVFGCFVTRPWERTNKYKDGGESFLWRIKKPRLNDSSLSPDEQAAIEEDIEVYKWTGANDLVQLVANDKLAMGGGMIGEEDGDGFGFMIDGELLRGSSGPCKTYNNPCLVSDAEKGEFEVANIEIWALTPFLFVAEAERSERSAGFMQQNLLTSTGQTPSTQSPWSQFL